ncbi:MAG: phage tail tape measure protein [Desulfovibrio sp.]|nr:phage tail tape measure protein [Desulfovibrio sp.]
MNTKDAAGNMRPLVDIIEELNVRTAHMGDAERTAVFKNVFGTEASAGMIALADQANKYVDKYGNAIVDSAGRQTNALRKQMETVADYSGTCEEVAKRQMATTRGSLLILSSAWQDVGLSVGNLFLPAIRAAAGALSSVANVLSAAVNRFPMLSKVVALTAGGIVAFTAASVGVGLVMNFVRTGLNGFRGALLRLSAAHVAATASTVADTTAAGGFGIASRIAGAAAKFFAGGLRSILIASGVGKERGDA